MIYLTLMCVICGVKLLVNNVIVSCQTVMENPVKETLDRFHLNIDYNCSFCENRFIHYFSICSSIYMSPFLVI